MAKLTLSLDGMLLKEIPLDRERTTIGRKPHNDIQIDNLAISGEHAVIVMVQSDAFLEDLNSTNGTSVNGQPIKKHFLRNGDVIELGKYRLKYLGEAQLPVSQVDFEKTMFIRADAKQDALGGARTSPEDTPTGRQATQLPSADRPPAAEPIKSPAPTPAPPPRAAIQILSGANAGKEMELTKTLSTLGKPGVQVAVITRRPHGFFITHVEGALFPSVNGKLLDAQAHLLHDHDIIELAGVKMEFFLKD